jgi:peptidoglycan/xylan/chitin deacetylase (PgdA/CDA1 family)
MTVLQLCWVGVTVCTVIFVIVAAISALPKMKTAWTAGIAAIFLAASGITAFGGIASLLPVSATAVAATTPLRLPPAPYSGAPLSNNASAGWVTFTFDDGPDVNTPEILAELNELHLHAVFFAIGDKAAVHPDMIRDEVASADVVGNHTWDHQSFTGKGTGKPPLTPAQVRAELTRASAAITAAGAPQPSLYRPPYGGVNAADDATARSLGLRIVLDSGDNIVDSNDWAGLSAAKIAARIDPVLRNGTIVAFHDGLNPAGTHTAQALPLIVAYMNAHHLGETAEVRPDATGGIVPYVGPPLASYDSWPAGQPPVASAASPLTGGAQPPSVFITVPATPVTPAATAPVTIAPVTIAPVTTTPATPTPTPTPTGPTPTPTPTGPTPTPTPTGPTPTPTPTGPTPTSTGTATDPTPAPTPTTPAADPTPTATTPAPTSTTASATAGRTS